MGCLSWALFKVKSKGIKKIKGDRPTCGQFTLSELRASTGGFSEENVLGIGGYGKVYKGILQSGQMAAIKVLFHEEKWSRQAIREFRNEVEMLSNTRHPNLVKLMGYCVEANEKVLVYEYMGRGSLADHLLGNPALLDWETRINIAVEVAEALQYLHSTNPPIIHRDVKSSNILLDDKLQAKLGDFGLAKYGPVGDQSHVTTRVMGSQGYCAPEYAATGKLTCKSDIYCLGVVLLELITGRIALDMDKSPHQRELVQWANMYLKEKSKWRFHLIDPSLITKRGFRKRRALQFIEIADHCLRHNARSRPDINAVVLALHSLASASSSTTYCT